MGFWGGGGGNPPQEIAGNNTGRRRLTTLGLSLPMKYIGRYRETMIAPESALIPSQLYLGTAKASRA